MKEIAKSREHIYGFLSAIYGRELTAQQISDMRHQGIFETLVDVGCEMERGSLQNTCASQLEEELSCEYAALFLGPGKHVYPFESAYMPDNTGKAGQYWGECAVTMKKLATNHGLRIMEKFESVPDHISVDFEFMRKCIECEIKAWEKDDTVSVKKAIALEQTFFVNHLNTWVPQFCQQVAEIAQHDFYREIARMTELFLQEEEQVFKKELVNTK